MKIWFLSWEGDALGGKDTEEGRRKHSAVDGLVGTLEWLIVAFATTLVFIVFEMQAYTIPTGSMAETLRGAHFGLRCPQCAYRYDYDFLPQYYGLGRNATPGVNVDVRPPGTRCPSCGYRSDSGKRRPVLKGDRIFVVKCLYQFAEPKRWDVVVFKNPLNPQENYIKRLIALPGETVEIVDGDIYIDDRIARKPRRVQEELWMCVYDNDYQPVNPLAGNFKSAGGVWRQPFVNAGDSKWNLRADGPTVFSLDGAADEVHTLVYDTRTGNDFKATYAYDDARFHPAMPLCSDLMVRFDVRAADSSATAGAVLSKYGLEYRGRVDFAGMMRIEKVLADGSAEELAVRAIDIDPDEGAKRLRFANADHVLVLEFGDERLECDLGDGRDDAGAPRAVMPAVRVFGSGELKLWHVGIFRDMHYINFKIGADGRKAGMLRAAEGSPFRLNDDEFFVMGDNTPASLDCRWWDRPGSANAGRTYRMGTVPRDYLVGKAFFVYWPGPYKPFNDTAIARTMERNRGTRLLKMLLNVPDVDGIKFLDGGSDD
ncbi:MAG: signal peptidase I [Planctomycetota bacterium]|nr:MAG: signal peptidase I [Planctomycetota bacterium]